MSTDETEEQLTGMLAACDEALAAGAVPGSLDQPGVTPEQEARLRRGLECMRLLRRVLPPESASPAPPPQPLPETLGRFQIRCELGRGGFGVVFLAHDPHLGRDVALKVPRADVLFDPGLR
jgi:hypothetical protein